jgi:hypothetical protein
MPERFLHLNALRIHADIHRGSKRSKNEECPCQRDSVTGESNQVYSETEKAAAGNGDRLTSVLANQPAGDRYRAKRASRRTQQRESEHSGAAAQRAHHPF